MAVTHRDGVGLAYDVTGTGPGVLLVAGFAADRAFWSGLVPVLAASFTVVTMDNRGVGSSDSPDASYDLGDMTLDAVAVLEAAGVEGRVNVVGHSMGGCIALDLARRQPQRVARIVLAQSFARLGPRAVDVLTEAGRAYDVEPEPVAALAELLFPWLFSPAFLQAPGVGEELMRLSLENPTPQSRSGYLGQLHALTSFDAGPWLAEVAAPTLLLAATDDRLVSDAETRALAAGLPRSTVTRVEGAGHCAPVERPEATASSIVGFLSSAARGE